jgi:AcrR family transcriptional regulator
MSPRSNTDPRREPRQERSRRQVSNILDAAAHVFAEVGYEAATTNAIAERAGASIGSLYQFFPNKAAIFQALTARHHAQLRELFDQVLRVEDVREPLGMWIDRIIDAIWKLTQSNRGFIQTLISHSSPELIAQENALIGENVARIEALLLARAPGLSDQRRQLLATVSVEVVSALLQRAATAEPAFGEQVLAETKQLLAAYLTPAIAEASEPRASTV